MISPLLLKSYFFPVISVVANPKWSQDPVDSELDLNLKVQNDLYVSKGTENNFQVRVAITIDSTETKPAPYDVLLIVIGTFGTVPDFPEKETLVKISGSSILYGAAREYLATITGRGPYPPLLLPSVSFLPVPQKPSPLPKQTIAKQKKQRTKNKGQV